MLFSDFNRIQKPLARHVLIECYAVDYILYLKILYLTKTENEIYNHQ